MAFAKVVGGVDKYFTPFYRADRAGNFSLEKYLLSRPHLNIVPQVLSNRAGELVLFTHLMLERGFDEVNLNLGCPFPMVVKRRLGAGLLPYPKDVDQMLSLFFQKKIPVRLSVKLRLGLHDVNEVTAVLDVLKQYPLAEVIMHPRLGVQRYKGNPDWDAFAQLSKDYHLVANGDIITARGLEAMQQRFTDVQAWMIGRGLLMNPCMLKVDLDWKDCVNKLHDLFLDYLREFGFSEPQILNQLKCFWEYPSKFREGGSRVFRKMKKVGHFDDYQVLKNRLLDLE
ncbi:tRNA-dihydrouridine synthase family protein [Saccharicrinis fermentans]|nr:tRNA-dihydrouridine synthase family protein [Saccharicrinis fermentans]